MKSDLEIQKYIATQLLKQTSFEKTIAAPKRKMNGMYLTNQIEIVKNVNSEIDFKNCLDKKILEPSCGNGIFLLEIIVSAYKQNTDSDYISQLIQKSIFFNDFSRTMVEQTKQNISNLFYFLFGKDYCGNFNCFNTDFTKRQNLESNSLFLSIEPYLFSNLIQSFDYIIGNPPYVALYGRRDKKQSEQQRVYYLDHYEQFPPTVKNGKINYIMLFLEHSLYLMKNNGILSFIIDVSFFETAFQYTRKYLLEKSEILSIEHNLSEFNVASGQMILKIKKKKPDETSKNTIVLDALSKSSKKINQSIWYNSDDEYNFRLNGKCSILKKIAEKGDPSLKSLYPKKNLRTCTMLLDMEDRFVFKQVNGYAKYNCYKYYRGSKGLKDKFGFLHYDSYFVYNKELQDRINEDLKELLSKQGVKNKKRIGLGEEIIYENPKLYIRQSAKELIATVDNSSSAANNSLYVFTLRNNSDESKEFLFYLCGLLNSNIFTYYSQQQRIIRYAVGKQPQIKTSDLYQVPIPHSSELRLKIANLAKDSYVNGNNAERQIEKIDKELIAYYGISSDEVLDIHRKIKSF